MTKNEKEKMYYANYHVQKKFIKSCRIQSVQKRTQTTLLSVFEQEINNRL